MDIDEFEKNLGRFSAKTNNIQATLMYHSAVILGNQTALLKGQALMLHKIDPSQTEDEYFKRLTQCASDQSRQIWANILKDTLDTDEEDQSSSIL